MAPPVLTGWLVRGRALPSTRTVCGSLQESIVELLLREELGVAKGSTILPTRGRKHFGVLLLDQMTSYVLFPEVGKMVPPDRILNYTMEILTST